MGTLKNFWGSSLDWKKYLFRFCTVLFLFFCFLSSGFAQDKAQLNQYLIEWIRSYWTCQGKGCSGIREKVETLLKQGADPNSTDLEKKTPLLYAVCPPANKGEENVTLVSLLLRNGANPNSTTRDGRTALMLFASCSYNCSDTVQESMVRKFIEHNAILNIQDSQGNTALMEMIRFRHVKAIQVLLENGADATINANKPNGGAVKLALEMALRPDARKENKEIADMLLRWAKNASVAPSIWLAVRTNNPHLVRKLLEAGADVNADDPHREESVFGRQYKDTPLIWAARYDEMEIVKILLEHGAEVDRHKGIDQRTAFLEALHTGHPEVALLLVDKRSRNLPEYSKENLLALEIAAEKGYYKIAKAMIDEGTLVDSRFGISNATPLMLAAEAGHLDVVKFLVEHGADLEAQSFDATPPGSMSPWDYGVYPFIGTPVMWARKGGNEDIALYLISKGANPHPKIKGVQ